jgi:DNA-binding MarR family transcriptional regulator
MVARRNDTDGGAEAGGLLREVARLHVRAQRAEVACRGTTVTRCHLLGELQRGGPATVTELARRLGLHKGWVSRGLAELAASGLVTRRDADHDGRAVVVALSRAGVRAARAVDDALDRQAGRVLGRIARAERAGIRRALELLRDALRDELTPPADGRRRRGSGEEART